MVLQFLMGAKEEQFEVRKTWSETTEIGASTAAGK
jgi:hypothetical protein